jgi:protein quaking
VPQALAGGGAGSLGGDKGNFGSGGGGGGGSGGDGGSGAGKGGEGSEQPKGKGWAWKGWTDRVAADPEFPFKVLLEQVSRAVTAPS